MSDTLSCLLSQAAALASGVMDKLDRPGHFTLFAPTNEAFENLNPGYLERIMKDKTVIAGILHMWYTNDKRKYMQWLAWAAAHLTHHCI